MKKMMCMIVIVGCLVVFVVWSVVVLVGMLVVNIVYKGVVQCIVW